RAVGITYRRGGDEHVARAEREVILAGGVINSPQLLMLSGIGEPDELRAQGIPVRVALPAVGRNLQDHLSAGIEHRRAGAGPFQRLMRLDRIAPALVRAWLFGTGPATVLPGGIMAFLKSSPDAPLPDVQLLFSAAPFTANYYLPPFRPAFP